jgi:integrase
VVILEFGGSAVTQRAVQPGAVPGDVLHDRAYLAIGWRGADGKGKWTRHSLRHVSCTTALFTWKLDPTGVSCMAGHANVRTTLLMYVGTTAGVLDRARKATD